jgi:hypothetical protein
MTAARINSEQGSANATSDRKEDALVLVVIIRSERSANHSRTDNVL